MSCRGEIFLFLGNVFHQYFLNIVWRDSSGELSHKGVNFTKAESWWHDRPDGFAGAVNVTSLLLCLEPHFFAHDFVVLKPDITGVTVKVMSVEV